MKKLQRKEKGITLVALLVTVVIMLILACVAILVLNDENGIIAKTKVAKDMYENAAKREEAEIEKLYKMLNTSVIEDNDISQENLITLVTTLMNDKILSIYPVGSIYISTLSTNPSEYIGGEWEPYSEGRTLIGAGTGTDSRGESLEFTLGQIGGEYNHLLTIEEMPSHSHGYLWRSDMVYWNVSHGFGSGANTGAATSDTSATGNDVAHNNLQPYIVTYMWKRIS